MLQYYKFSRRRFSFQCEQQARNFLVRVENAFHEIDIPALANGLVRLVVSASPIM